MDEGRGTGLTSGQGDLDLDDRVASATTGRPAKERGGPVADPLPLGQQVEQRVVGLAEIGAGDVHLVDVEAAHEVGRVDDVGRWRRLSRSRTA